MFTPRLKSGYDWNPPPSASLFRAVCDEGMDKFTLFILCFGSVLAAVIISQSSHEVLATKSKNNNKNKKKNKCSPNFIRVISVAMLLLYRYCETSC